MNFNNDIFFDSKKDIKFIVFDFETLTAYTKNLDSIELGAVVVDYNLERILDNKFQRLIHPRNMNLFNKFTIDLTGITPKDVENEAPVEKVITDFSDYSLQYEPIMVAQNAMFDYSILKSELLDKTLLQKPCIDLIKLAKFVLPGKETYRLDALAEYFDVPNTGRRHRALYDSELTAEILIKVLRILEEKGIENLSQIVKIGKINKFVPQTQISLF